MLATAPLVRSGAVFVGKLARLLSSYFANELLITPACFASRFRIPSPAKKSAATDAGGPAASSSTPCNLLRSGLPLWTGINGDIAQTWDLGISSLDTRLQSEAYGRTGMITSFPHSRPSSGGHAMRPWISSSSSSIPMQESEYSGSHRAGARAVSRATSSCPK